MFWLHKNFPSSNTVSCCSHSALPLACHTVPLSSNWAHESILLIMCILFIMNFGVFCTL